MAPQAPTELTIVGRSSSHFTRVTRIYALELEVGHAFQIVPDLMSLDPADYGENPSLKLPTLKTPRGAWFGALHICRELARQSPRNARLVWPEDLGTPLLANAQELVVQAMATEVSLVLSRLSSDRDGPHQTKMTRSLTNTLAWLEDNAPAALAALPQERDLSYLEVTLFCLVTHLAFRDVLDTAPYGALRGFCAGFEERASARKTAYRFDG